MTNDLPAQSRSLATAWLALAAVALALSTLWSIVLVVSRTPGIAGWVPAGELFRTALTLHVNLAALIWFLAFAGALWSVAAGARWVLSRWALLGLAAAGVVAVSVAPLLASGPVHLSNYFPVFDAAPFLVGLSWFVIGALVTSAFSFGRSGRAGLHEDVLHGIRLSALPALIALTSLAWSVLTVPRTLSAALYYEVVSWGPGHLVQFAFVTLMVAVWLLLARGAGVGLPPRSPLASAALWLSALPALAGVFLHAIYAPDTAFFRKGFTLLMSFGSWLGALPLGVSLAWRLARAWPRGAAERIDAAALTLSIVLFVLGCTIGGFIRTDSAMVPAHYHGTIGAVTVAFMAAALHLARRLGYAVRVVPWLRAQPWIYGVGLVLMIAGLAWAGGHGAPRKSPLGELGGDAAYLAAHALSGLGGLLAIIGSLLFAAALGGALAGGSSGATEESAAQEKSGEATPRRRRRDARPRALALTVLAIFAIGAPIAFFPREASVSAMTDGFLSRFRAVDKASHMLEMRRKEVAVRFDQGVAMLHARRYDHAVTAFHRVLALEPKMPEAHVNMGFALLGLGDAGSARDFFESATALRVGQVNAYYGLAVALSELGDLPAAIGAMRTYEHLAPAEDPYRRRAMAALWEWEAELESRRSGPRSSADGMVDRPARN